MFHYSRLGAFGSDLPRDMDGYVPEDGDDWRKMRFDLGSEREEYLDQEWWHEFLAIAVRETREAEAELKRWQLTE